MATAEAEYITIDPALFDAVDTVLAERHLADFMQQAWHVVEPVTPLDWGPHLDAMCLHLEALHRGEIRNLLITTPPGTTKSILCGVMFPAWTWIHEPGKRFLTASNEDSIALRDSVSCRRLITSQWYRERWGHLFSLTGDQNLKGWYENSRGGYRTTTTVGSKVTGKKGDLLILDDPHDAKKVHSEVERESVKGWWSKAFYNRVNHPKTSKRLVVGQRTHLSDLQAMLIAEDEFVHLNLPEEFDPAKRCTTSIGWSDWRTEPGELLRPARFGAAEVAKAKITGLADYLAQHQQDPIAVEGAEFPAEWFGASIWFDEWPHPNRMQCRVMTLDPSKGKDAKAGDYSAFVWGCVDGAGTIWIDADLGRYNVKHLAEMAVDRFHRERPNAFGVEVNQFQELLADQIERLSAEQHLMLPAVPLENTVKKEVRIRRLTPFLGRGEIRFKAGSPGTALLVEQLRSFPFGTHDDGPDALEMFIRVAGQLIHGRGQESYESVYA